MSGKQRPSAQWSSNQAADQAAVRHVLEQLGEALGCKDAPATLALYAERAVRFDLAPPLQQSSERSHHHRELEAWFATWEGPIEHRLGRHEIVVEGDLALVWGFLWLGGRKREGGRSELWFRITWALRRTGAGWSIVHEHQSVPFYMDGSMRAAVDLAPEEAA